mmetsp:Transcript_11346/g.31703  ORF Transcript_11346/g.31703 Transcript_11346/m.31703 type:complete len:246 (-) Transcript_11346:149-886(-)
MRGGVLSCTFDIGAGRVRQAPPPCDRGRGVRGHELQRALRPVRRGNLQRPGAVGLRPVEEVARAGLAGRLGRGPRRQQDLRGSRGARCSAQALPGLPGAVLPAPGRGPRDRPGDAAGLVHGRAGLPPAQRALLRAQVPGGAWPRGGHRSAGLHVHDGAHRPWRVPRHRRRRRGVRPRAAERGVRGRAAREVLQLPRLLPGRLRRAARGARAGLGPHRGLLPAPGGWHWQLRRQTARTAQMQFCPV